MLNKRILTLAFVMTFLTLLTGCLTPSNQAPILTSSPITTATVGVEYTYDVNATDPDGDTLTYSLATPAGMTINSANGLIKWTPVTAQIGDNPVTVKVSDGTLSITQSFKIKVGTLPPVNQAPVIISTPVATATVGVTYFYDVNATDPNGDTLTYSLTIKPSGMFINSVNGSIWWTPIAEGAYAVVVKVSDGALSDNQGFTIVVSKPTVPPKTYTITASAGPGGYISPLGDVIVNKGANISFTIIPNTNYNIADVLVDGGSVGAVSTYTFTNVAKDHTIHANFSAVEPEPEPEPEPEIELTGIEVDPKTMDLVVGKSEAIKSVTATYEIKGLEVPVLPGDCLLLSSDKDVATVDEFGLVTAEGVGEATITVSYEGKSDTIEITVSEFVLELVGIEVEPEEMTLHLSKGLTGTFVVTAHYNDEETKVVTSACAYGISDISIVKVDKESGEVEALKVGTATISISYTEGGITKGTTLAVIVEGTMTIRWLEDSVRFYPNGSVWYTSQNDLIPPGELPATLILTGGGYHFIDANEFYNYPGLPDFKGSVVIDGIGQLSGDTTYTSTASFLPIKEYIEGNVEIIIVEKKGGEPFPGDPDDYDGIMVGTYTQWAYAQGTEEEVTSNGGEGAPESFEGYLHAEPAPGQGEDWWFVGKTIYTAHGWK